MSVPEVTVEGTPPGVPVLPAREDPDPIVAGSAGGVNYLNIRQSQLAELQRQARVNRSLQTLGNVAGGILGALGYAIGRASSDDPDIQGAASDLGALGDTALQTAGAIQQARAGNRAVSAEPSGVVATGPAKSRPAAEAAGPTKALVAVDGGYETFYRAMETKDFAEFLRTRRVPASRETFVSPSRAYSEGYNGVLVEFQVEPGTQARLREMGVRAHGQTNMKLMPDLPEVKSGWGKNKALFKFEDGPVNIGLGRGSALQEFNESIAGFRVLRFGEAKK